MERLDTITLYDGPRGSHEFSLSDGSLRIDDESARITVPKESAPDKDVTGWELLASAGEPPQSQIRYAGKVVKVYSTTKSTGEKRIYKCEPAEEYNA